MAVSKSKSLSSRRSRQEIFLRYILRRKQCYILLLIEILVFFSFLLLLILFFWLAQNEMKQMEIVRIENSWKTNEQYKLTFYKCEYEPLWERPEQLNYVPCHSQLVDGPDAKIYDRERVPPVSCGGLFGTPMPYEYITSESDIRAPQIPNELIAKIYINKTILSSALHVKCPRCVVSSTWYASPMVLQCRRQLKTLRHGWPYIAKYCDLEEETEINLEKSVYC